MTKFLLCWTLIILLQIKSALLLSNPPSCGVPKVRKTALIVSGHDTEAGAWPWHAAIFHRNGRTVKYVCGGTLISEVFVLTAGHCVINEGNRLQLAKNRIFVQLGVYNLDEINPGTIQQHSLQKIHQPKSFTSESLRNDIALLELASVAQFNDYVQPACVSSMRDLTGQFGTAIGWGVTEDDETSSTLKKAQMPVIDPVTCLKSNRELFGNTLDESVFCAGYTNGTSVCNGDSGGGIFFNKGNVWYLGGIVSFTESRSPDSTLCYTKGYAGFTKVYAFLRWISSITNTQYDTGERILFPENDESPCEPRDADASVKYSNLLPQNCGVYASNRIAKGQKAKVFEFPWMASFLYRELTTANVGLDGAGSLINNRYVLTGVPLVTSPNHALFQVRLGEHTIGQEIDCNDLDGERECAPPARDYGVECIIKHQNYSGHFSPNDIALIRLDRNVLFESHIQPICLPVTPELRRLRPPRYIVTGWGKTSRQEIYPSYVLLKTTVPAVDRSICEQYREGPLATSELCAGEANGGSGCDGDGGGPLGAVAHYNGVLRFVQFGIFSLTGGCGATPSFYTSTASFMDWIVANMRP